MNDPTAAWIVPRDLLMALAGEVAPAPPPAPKPSTESSASGTYSSRLLVERWLRARGVAFRQKNEPDSKGRTVYVLKECPFDVSHADPDSCIMQAPDGKMAAHCFHNGCQGQGWQQFKEKIGPPGAEHYDPPLTKKRKSRGKVRSKRADSERSARPFAGEQVADAAPEAAAVADEPVVVESPAPDAEAVGSEPGITTPATPVSQPPRDVLIDPQNLPVSQTMGQITCVLLAAGDCYRRAGQLVRIAGTEITPVLSAPELAGLLNQHAEVLVMKEEESEYKPLPTNYANTWLNHPGQSSRLPTITMYTQNPVFTLDWRLTTPGFDRDTGIYYAGDTIQSQPGTEHLDRLLQDFCFKTPGDRTNYIGLLLTTVLMPRFIGSKPAVVFNGNQPGLGKSILAQIIAILRDGRPTETASFNPNDEEFEKRLGSIVRRGATTIIIDNAKAGGPRHPRIESACLERSITDPILSFRLLGYSKEIRAENSHIFCITANSAELGPDLVTRSVVVALFYEGDPKRRRFTMADPEGYALEHRAELLGELLGLVERWKATGSPLASAPTRFNKKGWGGIVGGILHAAGLPDFLANADTAAAEMDETRREFACLLEKLATEKQDEWTSADLASVAVKYGILRSELEAATPRSAATRLGLIAGRFIGESFSVGDNMVAVLRRTDGRKGNLYRVEVQVITDG
jgi:hypothetical protein